MKRIVTYARVSTEEQKKHGFSLQDQKRRLFDYARRKGLTIVQHIEEDYSAKDFNRPEFNKFRESIDSKELEIDSFVCLRMDRFSRNYDQTLQIRKWFTQKNIQIIFVEHQIDNSIPENLIFDVVQGILPQIENERRGLNTRNGMRQALRSGRWLWKAPKGYANDTVSKTIVPNDDALFIREAFEMALNPSMPISYIRRTLNEKGFQCSKQQFYNLLANPLYCGVLKVRNDDQSVEIVEGIHQPLISKSLFYGVQERLEKGKQKNIPKIKKIREEFPLRGSLQCPKCQSRLTASISKGRKSYHQYYHCQRGCNFRKRADEINESFVEYLSQFQMSKAIQKLYKSIFEDYFETMQGSHNQKFKKLTEMRAVLDKQLAEVDDKFTMGQLKAENYERLCSNISEKITDVKKSISELEGNKISQKQMLDSLILISNLSDLYEKSNIYSKRKMLGSIFEDPIEIIDGNYRTAFKNAFVGLIYNNINRMGSIKKKKASISQDFSNLAPPAGLEPATY